MKDYSIKVSEWAAGMSYKEWKKRRLLCEIEDINELFVEMFRNFNGALIFPFMVVYVLLFKWNKKDYQREMERSNKGKYKADL